MGNFNSIQGLRGFRALSGFLFVLLTAACAHGTGQVWNSQGQPINREELLKGLLTHKVILLGENHGVKSHQDQHLEILQALRQAGLRIHVGMEFFSYTDQAWVDRYRQGEITEAEFLKAIRWGSPSYDFYRDQAVFPRLELGERTWALNAPRSLTGRIARVGLNQLTAEERSLLPPNFQLGRDSYKKRFIEAMGGLDHLPSPEVADRYFAAQSVWDDTMAWQISRILEQDPDAVVVVIVGEFHVQYGGGLPDRLKARGISSLTTVSQIQLQNLKPEELQKAVQPHAEYGPRADWIWGSSTID